MKYLLNLLFLCAIVASTYGQEGVYKIDAEKKSLLEVLERVEKEYEVKFSYDPAFVKKVEVTLHIASQSRKDLLKNFLQEIPLVSKKVRNTYLILPKKKKTKSQLTGRIVDSSDGSPLAYAVVRIDKNEGAVTDEKGNFTIDLPRDSTKLTVSYLGYKGKDVWVSSRSEDFLIDLSLDEHQLPEFILDGNQGGRIQEAGFTSINPNQISTLPSLGETDVFKSLQLLPGISATDESISGLAVRGGTPDQNLILLDGFTIYHLDHFFGVFSTFNPNTINHVDVYKGGFDAKYGGRLSAVVDAKAKAWAGEKTKGGVNINSSSLGGYLQTPIRDKSFLNIGFRWSHFDLVRNPLLTNFVNKNRVDILDASNPTFGNEDLELQPEFSFYDFNAKWRFAPNSSELWDFNIYLSEDFYTGTRRDITDISIFELTDGAVWSNLGLSTNWSKDWGEKSSSEASISLSSYDGSSNLQSIERFDESVNLSRATLNLIDDHTVEFSNFQRSNTISDFTFKWHQTYQLDPQNELSFGLESNFYETDYSLSYFGVGIDTVDEQNINSIYLSNQYTDERLTLMTGFRLTHYDNTAKRFYSEPRLNLSYKLTPLITLKGGFSVHNQFVNRVSISPFGNSDQFYWVLADDSFFPVSKGTQLIWGANYQRNNWSLDVEAYSKQTNNILESEFALTSPFAGLEIDDFEDFLAGRGNNQTVGVDVLLKRTSPRYISWLAYTLSKSENTFDIFNSGNPFPSNFDQRHEFKWVNTYKAGKWELSSVFIFGSGKPFTPRGEISEQRIILFDVREQFNARRLPAYHRLDLSAKYVTTIGKTRIESGLTLFNLYNRQNVKSRRYSLRFNFDDFNEVSSLTAFPVEITLLGFTPNFFVNFNF